MDAGTARSLIAKYMTLLARLDIVERVEPVLSENDLVDPDHEVDACMDHRIPAGASVDLLRQAQRRLLRYIAGSARKRCRGILPLPETRSTAR